ncbi:MAG: hypothetical protein ACI4V1_02990 [Eubacteriales bacterium]
MFYYSANVRKYQYIFTQRKEKNFKNFKEKAKLWESLSSQPVFCFIRKINKFAGKTLSLVSCSRVLPYRIVGRAHFSNTPATGIFRCLFTKARKEKQTHADFPAA